MSLFVLDTVGNQDLLDTSTVNSSTSGHYLDEKVQTKLVERTQYNDAIEDDDDSEDETDFFGLPPTNVDLSDIIDSTLAKTGTRQTKIDHQLDRVKVLVDEAVQNSKTHKDSRRQRNTKIDFSDFNPLTGKFDDEILVATNIEKEMANSKLGPELEQLKELPNLRQKKQRALARIERSKTKGKDWFNLPATEVTHEIRNDLKILQMRSVLDPKHFYKKNDLKVLPKYFQIGTVQHSPLDYYSERGTRKNKKKSIVEELLADTKAQEYTKRKYNEVIARKNKYAHRKAMKKMNKLKKKK